MGGNVIGGNVGGLHSPQVFLHSFLMLDFLQFPIFLWWLQYFWGFSSLQIGGNVGIVGNVIVGNVIGGNVIVGNVMGGIVIGGLLHSPQVFSQCFLTLGSLQFPLIFCVLQ